MPALAHTRESIVHEDGALVHAVWGDEPTRDGEGVVSNDTGVGGVRVGVCVGCGGSPPGGIGGGCLWEEGVRAVGEGNRRSLSLVVGSRGRSGGDGQDRWCL